MKYILGIDVGGTKIAAGLVTKDGKVSDLKVLPTFQNDLGGQLVELIKSYKEYSGIGLGLPGQVLPSGEVPYLPNIPRFKDKNLKKVLEKQFRVPVVLNNDADAFAYAESVLGFGKGQPIVAGVILGTGIGLGMVIDKKIFPGSEGAAGEIGRFPMLDGTPLEVHVRNAGKFQNAKAAEKYLRLILSYVVLSFNPHIIILGGSWSKLPGMESAANAIIKSLEHYKSKTKVKVSKFPHVELVGTALPLFYES
jgi:predicted NBD/HSP70 family sugar kinase